MNEQFVRNRITELRLKKDVSEYQMSLDLGKNKSYIQGISSGRSMPSMKQFFEICDYLEIRRWNSLIQKWRNRHSSAGPWSC